MYKYSFGLLVSLSIALLFFQYVFGWYFLHPLHCNWLQVGDPFTYFYGFNFFNQEAWHFPLGATFNYSFPEGTSVVYSDSIPILAIIAKVFSYHGLFQYEGIWILCCLLLQSTLAYILIHHETRSIALSVIASVFFLTLPTLLNRSYLSTRHYSLLCHFLILWAMFTYYCPQCRKHWSSWTILMATALGIHFYVFLMTVLFFAAACWEKISDIKIKKEHFVITGVLLAVAIVLGYFSVSVGNSTAGGFGIYSMNLNALFNSMGRARLPGLPIWANLQEEGFNYLGAGLLIAVLYMAVSFFRSAGWREKIIAQKGSTLFVGMVFLTLLSLSYRLTIFNILLPEWFTVPVYGLIFYWCYNEAGRSKIKSVLLVMVTLLLLFGFGRLVRATGRMFWPVEYLLIFAFFRSRPKMAFAAILLVVQLFDLVPYFKSIHAENFGLSEYQEPPMSAQWQGVLSGVNHIALFDPNSIAAAPITGLAYLNHKTIGPMIVARASGGFRSQEQNHLRESVLNVNPDPGVLIIVGDENVWAEMKSKCQSVANACTAVEWGELDHYRYLKKK